MTTRRILPVLFSMAVSTAAFGQSKTTVGLTPFKSGASQNSSNIAALQQTVSDIVAKSPRLTFTTLNGDTARSAEGVDAQLVEQAKAAGVQYVITGSVARAVVEIKQTNIPVIGVTSANVADIVFTLNVVDVARDEVIGTSNITATGKGKIAFEDALKEVRPQVEKFIKDNFKLTVSLASVEEKNSNGGASKVLIVAGALTGVKELDQFRVFELTELTVDGKKMTRTKTLGKIVISKVEDANFSVCTVLEGGLDIAKRVEEGAKIRCEMIVE